MWFLAVLGLLAAALHADADDSQGVNPVQKVVTLLVKLQAEVEAEGAAEANSYDLYACFCKNEASKKEAALAKSVDQQGLLTSKKEDLEAQKAAVDSEISDINGDINKALAEQEVDDGIRANTSQAYTSRDQELSSAIVSMKGAIAQQEASKEQMTGAHTTSNLLSYRRLIKNSMLLAASMDVSKKNDPHAYTYSGNEIIAVLEGLLKDFKKKKYDADMEEQTDRQAHEMTSGARRNSITSMEHQIDRKRATSAELDEKLNALATELQNQGGAQTADQNFLNDLHAKCEQKAADWDQRSKARMSELTALSKALTLLKEDASSTYASSTGISLAVKRAVAKPAAPKPAGHWEWVPDAPKTAAQAAAPAPAAPAPQAAAEEPEVEDADDDESLSFLQLTATPREKATRKKVIQFLASKATQLSSKSLSTLLLKFKDTPTPFAKVKQMISDLVSRLEAEAEEEASQKSWCDENMKTSQDERDAASHTIESLNALYTEKNAITVKLTEEIAVLGDQIADLNKALNEEQIIRTKEQEANNQTVNDATVGKAAVEGAINVLGAFYGFAQVPKQVKQAPVNAAEGYQRTVVEGAGADGKTVADKEPDTFSGEYSGKSDSSRAIIGLLEVIIEDFSNTLTKTTELEQQQSSEFKTSKTDTEADIKAKGELKVSKEGEKTQAGLDIVDAESDLRAEKEVLKNALDELDKLKPVCVDSGMTWEERKARREQEIDSLQEALKIFRDTDFR